MKKTYIGEKEVTVTTYGTEEKTPGGVSIITVEYADGGIEKLSKLMYDATATGEPCDASALRDRRVFPVVSAVAGLMRDWGLKVGETPYFASVLNHSLNENVEEATKELWAQHMPKPASLDDVDLVTVDRILTARRPTLGDLLGPDATPAP